MRFRHANKTLQKMALYSTSKTITDQGGSMAKRQPAYRAFPPGELIREEIEYGGWSQNDLAQIMGRPLQAVNRLINGRKAITARTARDLARRPRSKAAKSN